MIINSEKKNYNDYDDQYGNYQDHYVNDFENDSEYNQSDMYASSIK